MIGLLIISIGGFIAYSVIRRPASGPLGIASVEQMAYPLPDKPSIAVLPFENMTGDSKQEFFTDGFTEQIITSLSKISSLFVISRNSMFSYKGKPVKVQQVSKELGVRYVLEGSIQKSGDRVRINVQLIDAISGRHVWAESYDRDLKDIFALQDEVILKIASALQVNLTSGEQARVWAEGTKSLEAYLKLMQSREYRYKGNRASYALAQRMAEEAIALDPKYAEAYAFLGWIYFWKMLYGPTRHGDDVQKATELTQKALAMNGSLTDAHSNLGILYWYSGRYDEGIAEAERAVELDPNSGNAYFALGFLLRMAGKPKEAIPVIRKTIAPGTDGSRQLQSTTCIGLFPGRGLQGSHRNVREGTQASAGPSGFPRHQCRCLRCLREGRGGAERSNRSFKNQSQIHRGVVYDEDPL